MHVDPQSNADAAGLRIAIVRSRYHADITTAMDEAARGAFFDAGGSQEHLTALTVPGTFELVAVCGALAERGDLDAVAALGCVIAGETTHDQYINHAVSTGLANITVRTGVPIAFGVLTCQTYEQALARAGGDKGNKGMEAMKAAIDAARTCQAIRSAEVRP